MALVKFAGVGRVRRGLVSTVAKADAEPVNRSYVKVYTQNDAWCLLCSTELSRTYGLEPGVRVNIYVDNKTREVTIGQEDGTGEFLVAVNGNAGVMKIACTRFVRETLLPRGVEHAQRFYPEEAVEDNDVDGQTMLFTFKIPKVAPEVAVKTKGRRKLVKA